MKRLQLMAVPNQKFSFDTADARFDLRIFSCGDCLFFDMDIDGERVLNAQRIVQGMPLIPYDYLSQWGNFILYSDDESDPNWRKLNTTQVLYFDDGQ